MLFESIEQVSLLEKLESVKGNPVELITEHHGAKVSISEHDNSSGFCDES